MDKVSTLSSSSSLIPVLIFKETRLSINWHQEQPTSCKTCKHETKQHIYSLGPSALMPVQASIYCTGYCCCRKLQWVGQDFASLVHHCSLLAVEHWALSWAQSRVVILCVVHPSVQLLQCSSAFVQSQQKFVLNCVGDTSLLLNEARVD